MSSRVVSKKIKNLLEAKYKNKCGFPGCKWPAVEMHHIKRFAIFKRHRVEEIVPLCKIHHELAHAGLIENEEGEVEKWNVGMEGQSGTWYADREKTLIDKRAQKFRMWARKKIVKRWLKPRRGEKNAKALNSKKFRNF